jgi:hypothetical protein
MGFFKTMETIRNVLAFQMNDLFAKHKLNVYVLAYVKNAGNNLSTMIFVLTSIVLLDFRGVNSFCTCLLGPCHVQVLPICHILY